MKRYYKEELWEIPDNWPASPDNCLEATIEELAEFPEKTLFYAIDCNSKCTLFSVDKPLQKNNYHSKYYYVAVWHICMKDGLADNLMIDFVIKDDKPIFPLNYFQLTANAHRQALLTSLIYHMPIHFYIEDFKEYLVQGKFDTAIREATVRLEDRMRKVCNAPTKSFGIHLVETLFANPPGKDKAYPHHLAYSKVKFKRFFSFVRNEFAHKINNPDMAAAINLLYRCCQLYRSIEELLGYPAENKEFELYK